MQSWLIWPQLKKNSSAPTAIIRTVKAWKKRWEEVLSIRMLRLELRHVRPGSSFWIFSWPMLVICMNHGLYFLFLADRSGASLVGSSAVFLKAPVVPWLSWLVYHLKPICPFSSDLWAFSVNPRDGCAWRSQKISSFWKNQTTNTNVTITFT